MTEPLIVEPHVQGAAEYKARDYRQNAFEDWIYNGSILLLHSPTNRSLPPANYPLRRVFSKYSIVSHKIKLNRCESKRG